MPAACAARQARISPSPCCMPQSPIGASASGSDAGSPRMVVAVLRVVDVDQDALAQLDALRDRRGWRAASPRRRSRHRHSRRTLAAPCGGRPAAGPRCRSWSSWRASPGSQRAFDSTKPAVSGGLDGTEPRTLPGVIRRGPRARPSSGCRHTEDDEEWINTASSHPPHDEDFEDEADIKRRREQEASRKKQLEDALEHGLEDTFPRFRSGLRHPAAAEPIRQGQPLGARNAEPGGRMPPFPRFMVNAA